MQKLLIHLLEQGFLEGWEDTDFDLAHLIKAVAMMRRGVMAAALWELRQVERWQARHLQLLKATLGEDILLNAFAEDYHNAFPWENQRPLDLVWGALLGLKVGEVYDYFTRAASFATRVVGLSHGARWERAKKLKEGDPLLLLPEPGNPFDPNAIHVFGPGGQSIGYLRSTLAAALAPRLAAGAHASACITCILGDTYPPDQRVNIRIELNDPSVGALRHVTAESAVFCSITMTHSERGEKPINYFTGRKTDNDTQ
ncbi:MAG: hypothetical protein PWQ41_944 [Bacillota bacterium]|nr:hypothetical protein [Bacillota bacterium]MDK2925170.1 hypothetical protein [Bacillota bacterium]